MKNQPCWRTTVSCGQTCGKPLSCGSHFCLKTCHSAGECEESCRQICNKPRPICGHGCQSACHAPFACSLDKPCPAKVKISCPCGLNKQEVRCGVSSNDFQNPPRPEVKCDEECRRRQLAAAFNVDLEKKEEEASNPYSDDTLDFYTDNKTWCTGIEKTLRGFCVGPKTRHAFSPMKSHLRQFIHWLAEDYGLESESEDPEPYRSVVVMKRRDWNMPTKTLADGLVLRRRAATAKPAPAVRTEIKVKGKSDIKSPVVPFEEPVDDWLEAVEKEEAAASSASAEESGPEPKPVDEDVAVQMLTTDV